MSYWGDIAAVLRADFLALDRTEAAVIGAPKGETVSLYSEMANRHGAVLAHLACAIFAVLIQRRHCANQVGAGVPMTPMNDLRAAICLVVGPVLLVAAVWEAVRAGFEAFEWLLRAVH